MNELREIQENVASLADADLNALLEQLEKEELSVSKKRRSLHEVTDRLQAVDPDPQGLADDLLLELRRSEHQTSERRLTLHQQITELRMEKRNLEDVFVEITAEQAAAGDKATGQGT